MSAPALALLVAIVAQEPAAMRAAPRASAPKQGLLWRGEWLEVRGERRDYLKVYSHRLERPGFVHRSLVRQHTLDAEGAPALRTIVDFVRDSPGAESLGIGYVALYLRAAPAAKLDAWVFDALGTMARRLAQRASSGSGDRSRRRHLAAHLEVARSYGVVFVSLEREEHTALCYDGDAFRRVLAVKASPEQQARAALALSDPRCDPPALAPREQQALLAAQLKRVEQVDPARVVPYLANQVRIRRSRLAALSAYAEARAGNRKTARRRSTEALNSFLRVDKAQLAARDRARFDRAALRVSALRWARQRTPERPGRLTIRLDPQQDGKTCVQLLDRKKQRQKPLYERCTYGLVWESSLRVGPRRRQVTLAVQHLPSWVETWVFRQIDDGWTVDTLVPAITEPELGYVEVAGWTPGGKQLLVVREALVDGRIRRRFQSLRGTDLSPKVNARTLRRFRTFKRWNSADWRSNTLALR